MKFLLDMGLARSTAASLRAQGYDATHLRELGWQRWPDERIVEKARIEARVIITHDLDFGRLVALTQNRLPSVITLRLDNMKTTNVNHYLTQVLSQFELELETGALVSVNERSIRVRTLPID